MHLAKIAAKTSLFSKTSFSSIELTFKVKKSLPITRFLIKCCCCRLKAFLRRKLINCFNCFLPIFFLCRKGYPMVSLFNQKNLLSLKSLDSESVSEEFTTAVAAKRTELMPKNKFRVLIFSPFNSPGIFAFSVRDKNDKSELLLDGSKSHHCCRIFLDRCSYSLMTDQTFLIGLHFVKTIHFLRCINFTNGAFKK